MKILFILFYLPFTLCAMNNDYGSLVQTADYNAPSTFISEVIILPTILAALAKKTPPPQPPTLQPPPPTTKTLQPLPPTTTKTLQKPPTLQSPLIASRVISIPDYNNTLVGDLRLSFQKSNSDNTDITKLAIIISSIFGFFFIISLIVYVLPNSNSKRYKR